MLATLSTVFLIIVFSYVYRKLTFWKRQNIPNDVASIYDRFLRPFHLADQLAQKKYGDVIGTYEGLRPTLMVTDPVLVKKVLVEEFWNFANHRIFYHKDQIAGKNIVVLEDGEWRRLRSILTPVFTGAKLRAMRPLFSECVRTLCANLDDATQQGAVVNMKNYLGCFSLDVIASTAFCTKLDSMRDPNNTIVQHMRAFFGSNISFRTLLILSCPAIMNYIDIYYFNYKVLLFLSKLTRRLIEERRSNGAASEQRRDVIQLLLEAKNEKTGQMLTDDEIADQLMLFMVAGYDTSSSALCAIVYCLAANPHQQDRLRAEVNDYLRSGGSLDDYEAIGKLALLDAVIKESLRMLPSVPRIERRSNKQTKLGQLDIPKDTMIIVPIYTLCHDERYFDSPATFDPDRWLESGRLSGRVDHVYLPFAAGPRSCIGARYAVIEMKAAISTLIANYQFSTCNETKLEYFTGQPVSTPKEVLLEVTKINYSNSNNNIIH